jgi:hypothetical protein
MKMITPANAAAACRVLIDAAPSSSRPVAQEWLFSARTQGAPPRHGFTAKSVEIRKTHECH